MNEEEADDDHVETAGVLHSQLESLPDELLLQIRNHLKGDNDVATSRNLGRFKQLSQSLIKIGDDRSDGAGRSQAVISAAGRLAKELHAGVYPRGGLPNGDPNVPRELRQYPSAEEEISKILPVLDLLTSEVQTGIVADICNLGLEARTAAVRTMCTSLGKLHDEENISDIMTAAVQAFTQPGDLHISSRSRGAEAVALGYEHLPPLLHARIHRKVNERPELRTVLAENIVQLNPGALKNAAARDLVFEEIGNLYATCRHAAVGSLLKHGAGFAPENRAQLIDLAVSLLERVPRYSPPPDHPSYNGARNICAGLSAARVHLTNDNKLRVQSLAISHWKIGKIWREEWNSVVNSERKKLDDRPPQHADVVRLRPQFSALPKVLASKDFDQVDGTRHMAEAISKEVEIARADRQYFERDRSDRSL